MESTSGVEEKVTGLSVVCLTVNLAPLMVKVLDDLSISRPL